MSRLIRFADLSIGLHVARVVPDGWREDEPHSTSPCSRCSPDLACCRLSRMRLALAGTRKRYAVSSKAANSWAEMSAALPRRDVISTASTDFDNLPVVTGSFRGLNPPPSTPEFRRLN